MGLLPTLWLRGFASHGSMYVPQEEWQAMPLTRTCGVKMSVVTNAGDIGAIHVVKQKGVTVGKNAR